MRYNFYIILSLYISLTVTMVTGQIESQWIHCSGEVAINNISADQARVIALRNARYHAVEQVCGISLQAVTLVKDFMLAGAFIHAISFGRVIEEKDIAWKTITIPSDTPENPPLIKMRVEMLAKVAFESGIPDPTFRIDVKLNQKTFQSGDEVIITVKSTKDCYLTVVNIAANDSVYVLFPNNWQKDNFCRAHELIEIPGKNYRDNGLNIRVANLPGHRQDGEIVTVMATKEKIDILDLLIPVRNDGLIGTPALAVAKLAQWLAEIPVSERAEATVVYQVQSCY